MPIYVYRCENCDCIHELRRSIKQINEGFECDCCGCQNDVAIPIIQPSAIHFVDGVPSYMD